MKIPTFLATLFILLTFVSTQSHLKKSSQLMSSQNYQVRQLYYSEQQNCCIFNSSSQTESADEMTLIIHRDNAKDHIIQKVDGGVSCDDQVHPMSKQIFVYNSTYNVMNQTTRSYITSITILQKSVINRSLGKIVSVYVNATAVLNPIILNLKIYECDIIGDGTIQHFRTQSKIQLNCVRHQSCDEKDVEIQ